MEKIFTRELALKRENLKIIIVPNGYTTIEESAFTDFDNVESIILAETVEHIEDKAFKGCKNLKSIRIPNSVNFVGIHAFEDCDKLDIGVFIYYNGKKCYGWIGDKSKCPKSIEIPQGVEVIDDFAFFYCENLEEILLPRSLNEIGNYSFQGCRIKEIDLPENLLIIEDYAFSFCRNLIRVTIPKTVFYIGISAFSYTSIKSIRLPEQVIDLSAFLFSNCTELETIIFSTELETIGDYAFNNCRKLRSTPSLIPLSVSEIGRHAFWGCESIGYIYLHDFFTSIGDAFAGNSGDCEIMLSSDKFFTKKNDFIFSNSGKKLINAPKTIETYEVPRQIEEIGDSAFAGCENLREIKFHNNVKRIGPHAFYNCKKLKNIVLPPKLKVLEECLFYYCSSLEWIDLPKGLEEIKYDVFSFTDKLEELRFPSTIKKIDTSCISPSNIKRIYKSANSEIEGFSFGDSSDIEVKYYEEELPPEPVTAREALEKAKKELEELRRSISKKQLPKIQKEINWKGINGISAEESIKKYRVTVKMLKDHRLYNCYVPHPEDDELCLRICVAEEDVVDRFKRTKEYLSICLSEGITLAIFKELKMADKLKLIAENFDMIEFFDLEDEEVESVQKDKIQFLSHQFNFFKVIPLEDQV